MGHCHYSATKAAVTECACVSTLSGSISCRVPDTGICAENLQVAALFCRNNESSMQSTSQAFSSEEMTKKISMGIHHKVTTPEPTTHLSIDPWPQDWNVAPQQHTCQLTDLNQKRNSSTLPVKFCHRPLEVLQGSQQRQQWQNLFAMSSAG